MPKLVELGLAYKDIAIASVALVVTTAKPESQYWKDKLDRSIGNARQRLEKIPPRRKV